MIQVHKFTGKVEITSDSCFSGKIAYRAKAYCEKLGKEQLYWKALKISASASPYKKSVWGKFEDL